MTKWSYEGSTGPAHWGDYFEPAKGNLQSPINIKQAEAEFSSDLSKKPLTFSYDNACFKYIENTGSSFQVTGTPEAASSVTGGPVEHEYKFLQFHIHWGKKTKEGSEHTVDGDATEAELHIVNWNSTLYKTPAEAASSDKNDGLIVLGIMLKLGEANSELNKIIPSLYEIPLKGQKVQLKDILEIQKLFPAGTNYWTYQGSLTTPPCYQSVQWVLFKDAIDVSEEQLIAFRELNNCSDLSECCEGSKIKHNYRPVCPSNNRKVFKSFE